MLSQRRANKAADVTKKRAGAVLHRINVSAADMEQTELALGDVSQFKSEFAEAVKNNPDAVNAAVEEHQDYIQEFAEGVENMKDLLPSPFEVYKNRREGDGIVMNIKGKGFPDYEEIVDAAASELGVSVEEVKAYYTPDMHDGVFWEDVSNEKDYIQESLDERFKWAPDIVVTGRSGGYWGLPLKSFISVINTEKFVAWLTKEIEKGALDNFLTSIWDNPESYSEIFSDNGDTYEYDGSPEATKALVSEFISADLLSSWGNTSDYSSEEIASFMEIDPDYLALLDDFKNSVESTIADFEKPDRWVENIVANEWYGSKGKEDKLEEAFVDEEEEF